MPRPGATACFGSHSGKLYAVDARSGTLRWSFQTEASRLDRLKILNADDSLKQDASIPVFGDLQDIYLGPHRFISIGAILSSPVVDRGVVYVGSMDRHLYALK